MISQLMKPEHSYNRLLVYGINVFFFVNQHAIFLSIICLPSIIGIHHLPFCFIQFGLETQRAFSSGGLSGKSNFNLYAITQSPSKHPSERKNWTESNCYSCLAVVGSGSYDSGGWWWTVFQPANAFSSLYLLTHTKWLYSFVCLFVIWLTVVIYYILQSLGAFSPLRYWAADPAYRRRESSPFHKNRQPPGWMKDVLVRIAR